MENRELNSLLSELIGKLGQAVLQTGNHPARFVRLFFGKIPMKITDKKDPITSIQLID